MIKASDILKTVKELGEKYPNRRAGNQYFHRNGHACCIIGHAFRAHGIRSRDFTHEMNGRSIANLLYRDGAKLGLDNDDDLAVLRLDRAQKAQDNEKPWGEDIQELG